MKLTLNSYCSEPHWWCEAGSRKGESKLIDCELIITIMLFYDVRMHWRQARANCELIDVIDNGRRDPGAAYIPEQCKCCTCVLVNILNGIFDASLICKSFWQEIPGPAK